MMYLKEGMPTFLYDIVLNLVLGRIFVLPTIIYKQAKPQHRRLMSSNAVALLLYNKLP